MTTSFDENDNIYCDEDWYKLRVQQYNCILLQGMLKTDRFVKGEFQYETIINPSDFTNEDLLKKIAYIAQYREYHEELSQLCLTGNFGNIFTIVREVHELNMKDRKDKHDKFYLDGYIGNKKIIDVKRLSSELLKMLASLASYREYRYYAYRACESGNYDSIPEEFDSLCKATLIPLFVPRNISNMIIEDIDDNLLDKQIITSLNISTNTSKSGFASSENDIM
jgi:hypothetical protein